MEFAKEQVLGTIKKVAPYIFVGVGIGAFIHNVIPQAWIESVLGSGNPFAVILATLVGVPMYADIFGTIPVAEYNPVLYDGGYHTQPSVTDYAAQGSETKTADRFYHHLCGRDHPCWIPV